MTWNELSQIRSHTARHLLERRDERLYRAACTRAYYMTKKKKVTKQSVIRLVKKHLDAVGHGINFEILDAGVRADDEWWHVPVLSSLRGKDVKRDVTVSIFATVENDLHTAEGLTVLLVPVVD
jgi:hypothetical protein